MKNYTLDKLKDYLKLENKRGKTWAALAEEFNSNPAVLWRIVHENYEPKNDAMRRKLGLPEIIEQKVRRNSKGRFTKDIG